MCPEPTPHIMNLAYPFNEKGLCRLCGKPVIHPFRYWHKTCHEDWLLMCGNIRGYAIKLNQQSNEGKCLCSICKVECKIEWREDGLRPEEISRKAMVDYITPLSEGGKKEISNVRILCFRCHWGKRKTEKKKNHAKVKRNKMNAQSLSKFGFDFVSVEKSQPNPNPPEKTTEKEDSKSTSGEKT